MMYCVLNISGEKSVVIKRFFDVAQSPLGQMAVGGFHFGAIFLAANTAAAVPTLHVDEQRVRLYSPATANPST